MESQHHLWLWLWTCVCVREGVCVCVCDREGGRKRERKKKREREPLTYYGLNPEGVTILCAGRGVGNEGMGLRIKLSVCADE